ncbi:MULTISPECIES: hypothetical protein [unclassified Microbacterium]|uniref:hypothetical protein n=1 Tax=unclassified Microbacterium TaxID=2609290 RepID=UPI002469040B|nr:MULTISPECIES: hypothetical protein [unclassified Microbacterium]MDH5134989.1 hypothetical protein [Microbacterium sp. RD10]MDH5138560.1 hypothetical protein [Microbacterium sp. RD11]MDH5146936.1 hypothetical protein [Microbacterium sp. RD12]MDH5156622.1 hypothetical protein [Microbacterium sp. RD06]MDH5168086.1 hypothetical protein [Microbacterium sp. RD02]
MDRLHAGIGIARRVDLAIREAGSDVMSVAQAADITAHQLEDRLSGRVDFQLDELVRVGGFLRIPAERFMEEAA